MDALRENSNTEKGEKEKTELETLTDKQKAVLRYLHQYAQENGFAPSIREIGEAFAIASLLGVTTHLDALERKGMLRREVYKERCIGLTERGRQTLGVYPELPGTFLYFVYDEATRCMKPLTTSNP